MEIPRPDPVRPWQGAARKSAPPLSSGKSNLKGRHPKRFPHLSSGCSSTATAKRLLRVLAAIYICCYVLSNSLRLHLLILLIFQSPNIIKEPRS